MYVDVEAELERRGALGEVVHHTCSTGGNGKRIVFGVGQVAAPKSAIVG